MIDINEKYMKRSYELAISAGKKGFVAEVGLASRALR